MAAFSPPTEQDRARLLMKLSEATNGNPATPIYLDRLAALAGMSQETADAALRGLAAKNWAQRDPSTDHGAVIRITPAGEDESRRLKMPLPARYWNTPGIPLTLTTAIIAGIIAGVVSGLIVGLILKLF